MDFSKDDVIAGLDILTSEWGRTFNHRGSEARVLTRFTGRSAGGHVIVKLPPRKNADGLPVRIIVETMSIRKIENLAIQFLNMKTAQWHSLPVVSVAFSPYGPHVLSGSWDTMVRLWDVTGYAGK